LLLRKDVAELFASRAFWLLLVMTGLLAGQSFISAVNAYAEASGPGALAQGLSPLDGILNPVAGAYDLAITLLFPFVAIRLVSAEKTSGALKLMLQWPFAIGRHLAAKVLALLVAWLIALIPFAFALGLWLAYGGHLDAGETLNVVFGYTVRFVLTSAIAMAAAAIMPGAANAAVVVLGFTIGTWALDFLATGRGGIVQQLAAYTPAAALRTFERGLLRIDVALAMLILAGLGIAITGIALRLGRGVRARILHGAAACAIALLLLALATRVHASFDLSENRRNSFTPAQQRMLAQLREPLSLTLFLAAEDPRMNDFERDVLVKLRRAVPRLDVVYPFAGRSALFENDDRYGTIVYRLGNRSTTSRSTTPEIVIETIAELAHLQAPPVEESQYPGYPLAKKPAGAAAIFYAVWPAAVIISWAALRSRRTG
jgi:ABC-2 type transport system permease protein